MNRPRVATVLSAREWEPRLVDAARRDPQIRIVRRAYEPQDLDRSAPLDAVVVGSETAWITSARIHSLRKTGIKVIGIYPQGDRPGRDLLHRGGVDVALPDTTPPEELLTAASMMRREGATPANQGKLIAVTGPRGAPGRTEVAISIGHLLAQDTSVALIDLDLDAPAISFRMGLQPGPDLIDSAEILRKNGQHGVPQAGRPTVIAGPRPLRNRANAKPLVADLIDASLSAFDLTVIDTGPLDPQLTILSTCDAIVLVCDASPVSLIRASHSVRDWIGPVPEVAINRVSPEHEEESARLARRALGLEPRVLLPFVDGAALQASPILGTTLDPLAVRIRHTLQVPS